MGWFVIAFVSVVWRRGDVGDHIRNFDWVPFGATRRRDDVDDLVVGSFGEEVIVAVSADEVGEFNGAYGSTSVFVTHVYGCMEFIVAVLVADLKLGMVYKPTAVELRA